MRFVRFLCLAAAIALLGITSAGATSGLQTSNKADTCFSAASSRGGQNTRVAVTRSKTCYACGLCTETSCCGSNGWFLENCTKPDGTSGKKCCKWD